jgi:hypothetical protein
MKQLLQGRSGRKNRAHASLKFGSEAIKNSSNSFGWQTQTIKKKKIPAPISPQDSKSTKP